MLSVSIKSSWLRSKVEDEHSDVKLPATSKIVLLDIYLGSDLDFESTTARNSLLKNLNLLLTNSMTSSNYLLARFNANE
jgi:hypothetical protein